MELPCVPAMDVSSSLSPRIPLKSVGDSAVEFTLKGTLRQLEGSFCTRTTPYTCNVCYIVSKKLCVFFFGGGLTTKLNFMFENDVIFSNEIFPNLILGSP